MLHGWILAHQQGEAEHEWQDSRQKKKQTAMRAAERPDHPRLLNHRIASSGQSAAAPGKMMSRNPGVQPRATGSTRLTPQAANAAAKIAPAATYAPATATTISASRSLT